MSTQKPRPEYKVIRNFVKNDEQKALDIVVAKHNQPPRNLEAFHTDKVFCWKPIQY